MRLPSRRAPVLPGRRLGVDVGSVRVGVALSDPAAVLASPLATLARDRRGSTDVDALAALVTEHEVVEVVVGLPGRWPVGMAGQLEKPRPTPRPWRAG